MAPADLTAAVVASSASQTGAATGEQDAVRSPRLAGAAAAAATSHKPTLVAGSTGPTESPDGWFRFGIKPRTHALTQALRSQKKAVTVGERSLLLANGKSGCRHRSVSSASPCERVGRRLRVPGGAEMDRGKQQQH